MLRELSVEEVLSRHQKSCIVDVRSQSEYKQDHLPTAYNIPLLDDQERALVGSVYHQKGPEAARILGLDIVGPKLPGLVARTKELAGARDVIVYCWRGGLRSKAFGQVLDLAGIPVFRLIGGYKAFRRKVNWFFEHATFNDMVVLEGLTGVGKTEVIAYLLELGLPALDLEGLAHHRGSVFGHLGMPEQPSQKAFETAIYWQASRWIGQRIITECESRRIGKLLLPDCVYRGIVHGTRILLYDSVENRIARIVREYGHNISNSSLREAVYYLRQRMGSQKVQLMQSLIQDGNLAEVVGILLREYYDPLYGYPSQPDPSYAFCVNTGEPKKAALAIRSFLAN